MTNLTWHQNILIKDVGRHLDLNPHAPVVVAVTEKAKTKYSSVLSDHFAGNDRLVVVDYSEMSPAILNQSPAVIALVAADIGDSRAPYAGLDFAKKQGIPVVFSFPERRHNDHPPKAENFGIGYQGMFWLAGQYAETIRPKKGAYCEFGVFDGRTMSMAYFALRNVCDRFYAYDSYSGISGSMSDEAEHYQDGQYYANLETLAYNLKFNGMDPSRISPIAGKFEQTLANRTAKMDGIEHISVVHIDTDVYLPALLALKYCEQSLSEGALLLFDDYDQLAASNNRGERRAFREWLDGQETWTAEPYRNYAVYGRAFILQRS